MDKNFAQATQIRQEESNSFTSLMEDCRVGQDALSRAISTLQDYYAQQGQSLVQSSPAFGGPVFSGAYSKRVDGATGIVGILEIAASDMARMQSEAQVSESSAAKAYTQMKQDYQVSSASKQAAMKGKTAEATRVTNLVADLKSDRAGSQAELDAVLSYLDKLKSQCEHKPQTFAERAARRKSEIASLQQALEILETETSSPAFLQKVRKHTL